jgi:hypothetical protein
VEITQARYVASVQTENDVVYAATYEGESLSEVVDQAEKHAYKLCRQCPGLNVHVDTFERLTVKLGTTTHMVSGKQKEPK